MPNYSTLAKQLETIETADRHRTEWTEAEALRLIDLAAEGGLAHAAKILGRTYYAVLTAHSLLLQGWVPDGSDTHRLVYRGWVEGAEGVQEVRL